MSFQSLREMQSFVRKLDVPEERREVVEAELLDHFFARIADGATEEQALAAFGAEDVLRIRFEPVERAFSLTRRDAIADGVRIGGAVIVAMIVCLVATALFWRGWFAVYDLQGHWTSYPMQMALDWTGEHEQAIDVWTRLLATAVMLALLAPRRRASMARVEPGAAALRLFLGSGLTLAAPLLAANWISFGVDGNAVDGMIGIAIWAATTLLLVVTGPLVPRTRAHG